MTTTDPTTKFQRHADVLIQVDPNAITFGIEIECLLPDAYMEQNNLRLGGYHTTSRHLPEPFHRWAITSDGSLISEHGFTACEIVSPILKGLDGLQQAHSIYQHLNAIGFKVNDSCGAHVHVGLRSLLGERLSESKLTSRVLRRLSNLVSQHEFGLIAITGNQRRLNNRYCRSVKNMGGFTLADTLGDVVRKIEDDNRYRLLNLQNLTTSKQTIEFRVFAGTTTPAHAISYILTALGLCQRACEVPAGPTFNPNDAVPVNFALEASALQKRLGWYNGKRYGVPAGLGRLFNHARQAQLIAAARFGLRSNP